MAMHAYSYSYIYNYSYALLLAVYILSLTNQKVLEGLKCLSQFPIATCVAAPVTTGGSVELNTNPVKPHLTTVTKDPSFIYFIYYLAISLLTYSTSC